MTATKALHTLKTPVLVSGDSGILPSTALDIVLKTTWKATNGF